MSEKQKVIVIIGPTGVGKTSLSIEIASKLNGEIISGDSMQIYKGMDIGTAKIRQEEMMGIPHHLIDIKNPDESFSAAEFQQLARACIADISSRGKIPIVAGGTGLYIQSLLYDYQFSEQPSDPDFRIQMENTANEKGAEYVHALLREADPGSAERIHPNNVRRVIRALEIYHSTGTTMTELLETQARKEHFESAIIGLTIDRETLYYRINQRVDKMMEAGLLKEVNHLYQSGLREGQAVQAIGYKEIYRYLDGSLSLEEAVEQLKQNSRKYAKRQLTWFRNKMDVEWFDMTPPANSRQKLDEIFTYIAGKLHLQNE
ncbi:tRNA (adenosine(37)-N6)-dimethylallyltransferase MiaA [Bacillus sp. FJAT-42376]|uniref:tRNA (adenosine(37)-N6)-dimethylallyltransferase MiaA n=1 Tax=Bacillus sp. FJAT-42376 TaxID=2014076 RepID=UPI000F50F615|nr:tRNA (adenosine(37)-N6)-dimethylallyltransferase MiaA [Bacillus sp. FJAT-42376]AZB43027.1 tRNA (adenosine(37)-N6)-dimethylallyltransferase MiaA [Bacillus sp. FJAT-42376]